MGYIINIYSQMFIRRYPRFRLQNYLNQTIYRLIPKPNDWTSLAPLVIVLYRGYIVTFGWWLIESGQAECMLIFTSNLVAILITVIIFPKFGMFAYSLMIVFLNLIDVLIYFYAIFSDILMIKFLANIMILTVVILINLVWINELPKDMSPPKKSIFTEHNYSEKIINNPTCHLCLEDYTNESEYYLLNCGHHAHSKCMENWWKVSHCQKCFFPYCTN